MAAITLVLNNATAWGASHGALYDGGKQPSVARFATGWVMSNTVAGRYALLQWGSERAATALTTTVQPAGAPTTNDCFRSANTYKGTFAATAWTIAVGVRSATAAYDGRFRLRFRVWKSANQSGSGATELTTSTLTSNTTTAALSTTVNTNLTASWTPGSTLTLDNEYLFVQVAIEVTTAGTTGTTKDVNLVQDPTNTNVVTSNFTADSAAIVRAYVNDVPNGANGLDYVLGMDDSAGNRVIQQDIGSGSAKNLFYVTFPTTGTSTQRYYVGVSSDRGASWSALAASNSEPNPDATNQVVSGAMVQDDTNGKVHFLSYDLNGPGVYYNRIALARDGSGNINGWSWEAQRVACPSHNSLSGEVHGYIERIVDANGVKRLLIWVLDGPGTTGVTHRLLAAATTPAAGLAPTGTSSWCKLTSSTSTNAFDVLGAWSTTTATDANALINFTSNTNLPGPHSNIADAGQTGNRDLHFVGGGFYYNDSSAAPGSIYRWRLTNASGSNWTAATTGSALASDGGASFRPTIGCLVARANGAYIAYSTGAGGIEIDKVNADGSVTANAITAPESATANNAYWIHLNVSADESKAWIQYMRGFNTPTYYRSGYWNGSAWQLFDETNDWANTAATGESDVWWGCRDVTDGIVTAAYMQGDYSTTNHRIQLHALNSPATAAGATGTVSVTTATPTAAASGTPVVTATSSVSTTATASAAGTPVVTGSVTGSAPAPSLAAAGNVGTNVTGTASVTTTAALVSAGTPAVTGSSSVASSVTAAVTGSTVVTGSTAASTSVTAAAAGTPKVSGSASATVSPTSTAAGTPVVTGSTSALATAATLSAAGSSGSDVVGSVGFTTSAGVAASGSPIVLGAMAGTLSAAVQSVGVVSVSGAVAAVAAGPGAALAGTLIVLGVAAVTPRVTLAGAGPGGIGSYTIPPPVAHGHSRVITQTQTTATATAPRTTKVRM